MKPLEATLILAVASVTCVAETPLGVADTATETIRQRDATGRVRVEREVRLNDAGDYVNHGVWRSWDEAGKLIGQGRYAWGKPHGVWSRWAARDDSPLLATDPFCDFAGPFLSQATYENGRLQGVWSVFDADGRRISEVPFQDGQRHGVATLWRADGAVYRESRFENGLAVGPLKQLSEAGELEAIATFEAGRRRIERVDRYDGGALRSRGQWLGPLTVVAEADDPWRVRLATFATQGEAIRDGSRESWWPTGQRKLLATYRQGRAVGEASWWHPNGQLALRGGYENGLAQGDWSWWRESGVRAAACRYLAGKPAGEWSLWSATGSRLDPAGLSPEARERLAAAPGEKVLR